MDLRAGIAIALFTCLPCIAAASLRCAETDRMGNRSVASIQTNEAGAVESFHWVMKTPRGDRCEFDSADFLPVRRRASVEFQAANGCRLFVWTQGRGVTLAHNTCEGQCTGPAAHDYLWPIIFDVGGGGCGRVK